MTKGDSASGTLTAVPFRAVAIPGALGALLLMLTGLDLLGGPGSLTMWLGLASLAGAAAYVLDDPAAAVTAAVPTRVRVRLLERLLVPLALLFAWVAYAVWVGTGAYEPIAWAALGTSGVGVLLVTLGAASLCRLLGVDEPGSVVAPGVTAGVVLALLLPGLPGGVELLLAVDTPARALVTWAVLATLALAALVAGTRDPWRVSRSIRS